MSDPVIINKELPINIMDFVIMQEISEMKLNRELIAGTGSTQSPRVKFYNDYKNSFNSFFTNGVKNIDLINEFKVSVGATENLQGTSEIDPITKEVKYDGGAGKYTKISSSQVDEFIQNYKILDYYGDDISGFSATVFENLTTHEKTISFRSTEFSEDFLKDTAADNEIKNNGTAWGQSISMVKYIEKLKTTGILTSTDAVNVTGYSLGGALGSTFYKMYANDFNIQNLYFFNSPGAGGLTSPTTGVDPYVSLKNDMNAFNVIQASLLQFYLSKAQTQSINQLTATNYKTYLINTVPTLWTEQQKQSLIEYADYLSKYTDSTQNSSSPLYKPYENFSQFLGFVFNSTNPTSYISAVQENEQNKDTMIALNGPNSTSGLASTLYGSSFYQTYQKYLIQRYNPVKAGDGTVQTIIDVINGKKTGELVDPSFYGNKAIWISGTSSLNYFDKLPSDYNFVSNSNKYTNPLDLIIEDRPELERDGTVLPMPIIQDLTKDLKGDFGNTHSITLLNKSLSLMTFLAKIEGKTTINVQKYTGLISSASPEKASGWISDNDLLNKTSFKDLNIGDNNSIAVIINSLYKTIVPNQQKSNDIIFDNTIEGWADINKIDLLEQRKNAILNVLNNSGVTVDIHSFYHAENKDFDFNLLGSNPVLSYDSKEFIYLKIKQNDAEGMAYRYALENLSPLVVLGLDYANMDFKSKEISSQSDQWYLTRIDVLLAMVKESSENYGDYISRNTTAIVDDKDQYIRFHTNNEKLLSNLPFYNNMATYETIMNTPVGATRILNDNYQTFYKNWTNSFHTESRYGLIKTVIMEAHGSSPTVKYVISEVAKNTFGFSDNIYYLNPLSSSFYSRNERDNEKIFIDPNKQDIFNHMDGTNPFTNFTHGSYSSISDFNLISYVDLRSGNDYIEVKNDYATIIGKSGTKTYYLDTKEANIIDYYKTGTITLDGILLKGGKRVDVNRYVQTELVDGIVNTISYQLDYENKALVITHENTGHKVYIDGMANMGNGVAFNFDELERNAFSYNGLTQNDFIHAPTVTDNKNVTVQSTYATYLQFLNSMKLNIDISPENAVREQVGNNLVIYDREQPSHVIVVQNFYDSGSLKEYKSLIEINPGNPNTAYQEVSSPIVISIGMGPNDSLGIYDISRQLIDNPNHIIDYRSTDEYLIPGLVKGINLQKNGNDLVFSSNGAINSEEYKITVRNYFSFDHQVFTDIFTYQNGVKTEIPFNEISKYITIKLSDNGNFYQTDGNSNNNTVTGGNGDDTVVGTSRDEVFQSLGTYVRSLSSGPYTYNAFIADGNDVFTGGGGNDIFIFTGNFGSDVITDFRSDDKIILGYSELGHSMRRENDDLILYNNKSFNNEENYGINYGMVNEVRVKDYFLYIDYQNDSRISYVEIGGNAGQINYVLADENNTIIPTYTLTPTEISSAQTTQMTNKDFNQGDTVIDNSNPAHPVAINHGYLNIVGNSDDNIITITKNNTIVKGNNDNGAEYDGDDTYIINITETVPSLKNTYRTEIDFGLNGGNDIIKNGDYKESNQYGDIVKLKNIDLNQLVFNKQEDNGILKSISIILQDGSSIKLEVNNTITNNSEILKLDNQVLTLAQINALINTNVVIGNSNDNTFDYSASYKNQEIHGMAGNDTITGGFGDDVLEGGKGYDDFYFSGGKDTYIFNKGDNVDIFHFKNIREKLNSTFLIDNDFNTADIKYSFDDTNHKIYLSFSKYEGVVFADSDWLDFVFLQDGITIKKMNGEVVVPPDEIKVVSGLPFITPANLINGTSGNDTITTDNSVSNVIYAKEGNDTIVSQGSQNSYSMLFGGTGDDNIVANRRDIVVVKDGDGADIISSTSKDYMIDILHSTTRMVNGQETLFDLSVNGNDLSLKYGTDLTSNDKVTIKDYFLNNATGDISLGIYEESLNQTKIYYLNNILQDLGITKSSLQNQGDLTINKSDVILRGATPVGEIMGGEIAYQYLHGNYQTADAAATVLNQMNNGHLTLLKQA